MAFVPGYDHDVFISYAHVDNQPLSFGGKDLRWVTCLKQQLQRLIDQQLGRTAATKIWMDLEDLGGNDSVTPTLEGAIRKTATLVVVLSLAISVPIGVRKRFETLPKLPDLMADCSSSTSAIFHWKNDPNRSVI